VFVQAASKTLTSKEYFLRTHGFDEVAGREELGPRFADAEQGPWGPHDAELVTYVQERIARLEAQRAQDGRPFLLVMLTLDTHEPGMARPDCPLPDGVQDLPADAAGRKLAASFHCSDAAIGRLGRFLLDDARRDQTVWLLTADHAIFPDLAPPSIYPTEADRKQFTQVPFLLHDPLHLLPARIDTLSGTRDVAPTLLHLLGVTEVANSMTGRSIFGGRREHPFLIGRVGERLAFARTPQDSIELPVGEVRQGCREGRVLLTADTGPFTACDLAAWLDWQDGLWDAARLFPPKLYHGADGVLDPEGLAAKQEDPERHHARQ
jgi:phosphoglycerol transferase MdoB-like AlkP superfamily enzyme